MNLHQLHRDLREILAPKLRWCRACGRLLDGSMTDAQHERFCQPWLMHLAGAPEQDGQRVAKSYCVE